MAIELNIPIEPVPKGRPRFTKQGFTYTPKATKVFEAALKNYLRAMYHNPPIDGPLSVRVTFMIEKPKSVKREYPTVKPDTDNYIKGVLDAANGILWKDDCQIIEIWACKFYGEVGSIQLRVDTVDSEIKNTDPKR
jgi:Holliday junction resolvase RusA-like endonuclease